MSGIVVLGAGPVGLATAMMLADQGHEVTVFERDPQPCPDSPQAAWDTWERHGVAQFRQAHYLHPGARRVLEAHFPEVATTLAAAGALQFDTMSLMPGFITDREPRPDDAKFVTLTARRPVIDYAFGTVASRSLDIRRDVYVTGLLTGTATAPGIPHVAGVRLASGEEIRADLVVDSTGRRSKLPDWLEEIGARPVIEEVEDYGFVYYTRFFRARDTLPVARGSLNTPIGSISILTLPSDSQTWSVTVFISSADAALKTLRETGRWTKVVAACPNHAHWLDGEPISEVLPIAGVTDRHRHFVVDGRPVATGIIAVGDSLACTNPSLGRGITLGLMHALESVGVVGEHFGNPLALARAHHEVTAARLTPWYRNTVGIDRSRAAAIHAEIDGTPLSPPDDPAAVAGREWALAMLYDADVYRSFAEMVGLLAPPSEIMARPGLRDRIHEVATSNPPLPFNGPSLPRYSRSHGHDRSVGPGERHLALCRGRWLRRARPARAWLA